MGIAVSPQIHPQVAEFLETPRKMLINGKWVSSISGKTFATYNPATGEILAPPSLCGQSFSPPSLPFENLLANQTQNFTASPVAGMFSISGQVGGSLPFTSFPVSLTGSQSDTTETRSEERR